MAVIERIDGSGNSYTEIYVGPGDAPVLGAKIDSSGITGTLTSSSGQASETSYRAPVLISGNADAQVTARDDGTVRGADVATGGAGNVIGSDLILRGGKGTGTGDPGKVLMYAAPAAAAGDNLQVPAQVAAFSDSGLTMSAGKAVSSPTVTATTSATTPIVYGGTAVGSELKLNATSGVGVGAEKVTVNGGNNGGTNLAEFTAAGQTLSTKLTVPDLVGGTAAGSTLDLIATSGTGVGAESVNVKTGDNGNTTCATFATAGQTLGTSVTVPKVKGGTAVGSELQLIATSGVGAGAEKITARVGNDGATTMLTVEATGTTLATQTVTPKVIGGSAVGSDLTLQSTSGVGDGSDQVLVKVGNAGGTTVATFDAAGQTFGTRATVPIVAGGSAAGSTLTLKATTGVGVGAEKVDIGVGNDGGTVAASFTPAGQTLLTSVTVPAVIGGSGVSSDLTIQSTSGAGDGTDTVSVKCGNAGGTTALSCNTTGTTIASQVIVPLAIGGAAAASTLELRATTAAGAGSERVFVTGGNNGGSQIASFDTANGMTAATLTGGTAAGSSLTLKATSGNGVGAESIVAKVGNDGATTVLTVNSLGLALSKPLAGTQDTVAATGAGVAASTSTLISEVTTDGDGLDNVTLGDGIVDGQIKIISVITSGAAGDSVKITPAKFLGGTQHTFAADCEGKGCMLVWSAAADKWNIVSTNGGLTT